MAGFIGKYTLKVVVFFFKEIPVVVFLLKLTYWVNGSKSGFNFDGPAGRICTSVLSRVRLSMASVDDDFSTGFRGNSVAGFEAIGV